MAEKNLAHKKLATLLCRIGDTEICPLCLGKGFVLGGKDYACPNCKGSGFIEKEAKQNTDIKMTLN